MVPLSVPPAVSSNMRQYPSLRYERTSESDAAKNRSVAGSDPVLAAILRAKTPPGGLGSLPATGA